MDSLTQFLDRFLSSSTGVNGVFEILGAMAIAYLGGILASLTPCIYPMIPITVGVVGGMSPSSLRTEGQIQKNWMELTIRILIYVSGMAVVYSFLGVLAGLTGQVFGTLTNSSGWYLIIGIVMSFSALLMFEVIPFDPMAWWERFKHKKHKTHVPTQHKEMTHLGAFVLGLTSGFIAGPCTTPVLTAVLAYIAKTQSVGLGLLLMFCFAIGLGTILILIGFFTGMIQNMPRSGTWMKKVKIASGLILLAFGEYLIYKAGTTGGQTP